jgi:hypothetical protein
LKMSYFHQKRFALSNCDEYLRRCVTGCCKSSIGRLLKRRNMWISPKRWKIYGTTNVKCVCSINYYHHSAVFHLYIPLKALTNPMWMKCDEKLTRHALFACAALKHEWMH